MCYCKDQTGWASLTVRVSFGTDVRHTQFNPLYHVVMPVSDAAKTPQTLRPSLFLPVLVTVVASCRTPSKLSFALTAGHVSILPVQSPVFVGHVHQRDRGRGRQPDLVLEELPPAGRQAHPAAATALHSGHRGHRAGHQRGGGDRHRPHLLQVRKLQSGDSLGQSVWPVHLRWLPKDTREEL